MRWAALLIVFVAAGPAHARPAPFWQRAADPQGDAVDELCERARRHLDLAAGGVTAQGVAHAQALLDEAQARQPRHFQAALLRGEALALSGHASEAAAAFQRACDFATEPADQRTCHGRLALEQSRAGRYAEALAIYQRQILAGQADTAVLTNAAELLMAQGRLAEAADGYRQAARLASEAPLPAQDAHRALAYYGLAVALDRLDRAGPSREALAAALALDPGLRLIDPGNPDVFFVPTGDVHYYRGLAFALGGRRPDAIQSFQRFLAAQPSSPFAGRASAQLAALGAPAATPAPAPAAPKGGWHLVAAATVRSDGPIPAPLIDAAWKSRPRLTEPCFEGAPPLPRPTLRLGLDLTIDAKGALTKVTVTPPAEWRDVPACLEARLTGGLRLPRPTKPAPTTARVELVLAWR